MVVEQVEVLQPGILDLVLLCGSVEVCNGVDDRLQPGLVIRIFDERLQHLRMRLRPRAKRMNHFTTSAVRSSHLQAMSNSQ